MNVGDPEVAAVFVAHHRSQVLAAGAPALQAAQVGGRLGGGRYCGAGQNITGAGNARASGYVGTANAITNGLGQAYNMYQQNQLMGMLKNKNTAGAGGSSAPAGTYFDGYGYMPIGGT